MQFIYLLLLCSRIMPPVYYVKLRTFHLCNFTSKDMELMKKKVLFLLNKELTAVELSFKHQKWPHYTLFGNLCTLLKRQIIIPHILLRKDRDALGLSTPCIQAELSESLEYSNHNFESINEKMKHETTYQVWLVFTSREEVNNIIIIFNKLIIME